MDAASSFSFPFPACNCANSFLYKLLLLQVVPEDEHHPRFLSLRASGRQNPLTFELDSDELYDILSKARTLSICVCVCGV